MLTCERVGVILRGIETSSPLPSAEAEEIDEILALGLAIEADPDDLAMIRWLRPFLATQARGDIGDAHVIASLETAGAQIDKDLKNDWYRMTTRRTTIQARQQELIELRRTLGILRNRELVTRLMKLAQDLSLKAESSPWVVCPHLGVEVYAITTRGQRVARALAVRQQRFANVPIKTFLHTFDKTETKMRTFGTEIATLSHNIGYVKKNREQVVIGLAKVGVPAGNVLGVYHAALTQVSTPDVAVTCARNAKTFGTPQNAALRLRHAQEALLRAGFPRTPIVIGAAKSILGFEPIETGVARFRAIHDHLIQVVGRRDEVAKYTARLMTAAGSPADVANRTASAMQLLGQLPSQINRGADRRPAAVALASMVKTQEQLPALVQRYRELENALVAARLSNGATGPTDALECVACPGTAAEVVDTISALAAQLTPGRNPSRSDIAIAIAFAKRFAY